jgi:hypothetical protein
MNCPNCHSSNTNVKNSQPWSLVCYILSICFGGTGIVQMIGADFSGPVITALLMGLPSLSEWISKKVTMNSV